MEPGWKDIFDYTSGHKVKWMRGGIPFFDEMARLIGEAKSVIHLQVYLIDPDETGNLILTALENAARRGVKVYLVVDGFGANRFDESLEQRIVNAGIIFKKFETFISTGQFYVGRRMHHKVMIIDSITAMVGGMNIADRYRGTQEMPAWLDYAVIVEGPVAARLVKICTNILEKQFTPAPPRWPKIFAPARHLDPEEVWVRIRKNDWLRNRREITTSYNKATRLASRSITIVGGYFIPGRKYRKILANAAKRGVEIKVIMAHYSDVPVVKYASDYLYGFLLDNNIRIFESNTSMVHGKVAIVDEKWTTVGSYNQNHLSAYLSIELNLDIVNQVFSSGFQKHLNEVMENECTEVTREKFYSNSGWYARVRRWIAYQLVRISLRMLFVVNRIFYVDD